jgi:hypothetical protein
VGLLAVVLQIVHGADGVSTLLVVVTLRAVMCMMVLSSLVMVEVRSVLVPCRGRVPQLYGGNDMECHGGFVADR